MQPPSFEYVPVCDFDTFTSPDTLSAIEPSDPPEVHVHHTIDDVVLASTVQAQGEQAPAGDEQAPVRSPRVYVRVQDQQLSILAAEFAKFGVTKPLKY